MTRKAFLLAILTVGSAAAEEFVARADVVDVIPIYEPASITPLKRCDAAKPDPSEGLAATLRWDLCVEPAMSAERPSAYRVIYEWDNRIYERTMNRRPGKTVPVRVRLD